MLITLSRAPLDRARCVAACLCEDETIEDGTGVGGSLAGALVRTLLVRYVDVTLHRLPSRSKGAAPHHRCRRRHHCPPASLLRSFRSLQSDEAVPLFLLVVDPLSEEATD